MQNRGTGHRRSFIGGSDARIIVGNDEAALLRLWGEKRGEIRSEDLSGNLVVQLGLATEELNRRWNETNDIVVPKLEEKLSAALRPEYVDKWEADCQRVQTQRDALAEELTQTYPASWHGPTPHARHVVYVPAQFDPRYTAGRWHEALSKKPPQPTSNNASPTTMPTKNGFGGSMRPSNVDEIQRFRETLIHAFLVVCDVGYCPMGFNAAEVVSTRCR